MNWRALLTSARILLGIAIDAFGVALFLRTLDYAAPLFLVAAGAWIIAPALLDSAFDTSPTTRRRRPPWRPKATLRR